jgi:hypothetical protein
MNAAITPKTTQAAAATGEGFFVVAMEHMSSSNGYTRLALGLCAELVELFAGGRVTV